MNASSNTTWAANTTATIVVDHDASFYHTSFWVVIIAVFLGVWNLVVALHIGDCLLAVVMVACLGGSNDSCLDRPTKKKQKIHWHRLLIPHWMVGMAAPPVIAYWITDTNKLQSSIVSFVVLVVCPYLIVGIYQCSCWWYSGHDPHGKDNSNGKDIGYDFIQQILQDPLYELEGGERRTFLEKNLLIEGVEPFLVTPTMTTTEATQQHGEDNAQKQLVPPQCYYKACYPIVKEAAMITAKPSANKDSSAVTSNNSKCQSKDNDILRSTQCALCCSFYQSNDIVCWSRNPQCQDAFHKHCAMKHLDAHSSCPVCQRPYIQLVY